MNEEVIEKSRKNITKLGSRLKKVLTYASVFFRLTFFINAAGLVLSLISDYLPKNIADILYDETEGGLRMGGQTIIVDLDKLPVSRSYEMAIFFGMTAINALLLIVMIRFFKKLLSSVVDGKQPFTQEAAKLMRRYSYFTLFFILENPLLAMALFMVMRLFSYLFEYGAYLQEKADKTNRIQEEMIISFAEITENKSGQTGQHVKRVAEYSRILAEQMGLGEEEAKKIRLASTMHDVGKLIIPSEILEKPSRLTDEEFATIKTHTTYGGKLLENVEGEIMELSKTIAMEHHERIDGKGYPAGKKGDEISPEGRIVAVADVYDALTSKRSYKNAWDPKQAYDEIVKNSGTQFDEQVVEAFKQAYDTIEETRKLYADKNA